MSRKIIITLVVIVAAVTLYSLQMNRKARPGDGADNPPSAQQTTADPGLAELTLVLDGMNDAFDTALDLKVARVKNPLLVVPFTNSDNIVTSDSLAVYLPTLLKTSWSPEPLLATPYPHYIRMCADVRGMLTPGTRVSATDIGGLSRALGCRNTVEANIDVSDGLATARMTIVWKDHITEQEPISVPEDQLHTLPSLIARQILATTQKGKLPDNARNYLERPAARNAAQLRQAGVLGMTAATRPWFADHAAMSTLIAQDEYLDWLAAIQIIATFDKLAGIEWATQAAGRRPNQPYFQLLIAEKYVSSREHARIAAAVNPIIQRYPETHRAWEMLGYAMLEVRKQEATGPVYEKLIKAWPDLDYAHYYYAYYQIQLSWHYRGTGFASTVTQDGWKNMRACLEMAQTHLFKAIELDPLHYRAHNLLIETSEHIGGEDDFWKHFYKAVEINPNFRPTYSTVTNYLQPKWGGGSTDLPKFWKWTLEQDVDNPYVYINVAHSIYTQAVWQARDFNKQTIETMKVKTYLERPLIWNQIEEIYRRFSASGVDDPNERAFFAYLISITYDNSRAVEEFKKTNFNFRNHYLLDEESFYQIWANCALESKNYQHCIDVCDKAVTRNWHEGLEEEFDQWKVKAQDKLAVLRR